MCPMAKERPKTRIQRVMITDPYLQAPKRKARRKWMKWRTILFVVHIIITQLLIYSSLFLWQANVKTSRPKKPQDSEKAAKVTTFVFAQMT